MTTINGVTFNMVNLRPVAVHRNSISEQPGSDTNFITDMGYDGLVLRLEGWEKTLADYDSVISEFMKSGEQTLVYRTGCQFNVYSAQLTPELMEGIVDNYFPYDLILYTSTPYRESTTLDCRAKEITTNNQEWSAEDMPCNNLLDNWSVEYWAAGPSAAPDGWTLYTGSIAKESTIIKHNTYSAKITNAGSNSRIEQLISNYSYYSGRTVTLGGWVYSSEAGAAMLQLSDGLTVENSTHHTGGGTWEWLTVTRTNSVSAIALKARLLPDDTNNNHFAYFDGVVLVEGDSIPDNTFIRDIDTDGSVDAVPDIKVIGGAVGATIDRETVYSDSESTVNFQETHSTTYVLIETYTITAKPGVAWNLDSCGYKQKTTDSDEPAWNKITYQAASLNGGAETDVPGSELSTTDINFVTRLVYPDILCAINENIVIRYYHKQPTGGIYWARSQDYNADLTGFRKRICDSPAVYNTADTTVQCEVGNEIYPDMVTLINVDGTGTIDYDDDFSTTKYTDAHWYMEGVTHDSGNDELDIADDGYIYYKFDTKHPITGIPTLTSRINIITGIPTIQISSDASTWYDITTAIVDDVDTVYDLDSTSLSLKSLTTFYWRIDCVKAAAATVSIKSFELDLNIVTIDVEHPVITTSGSASTFRCDQDANSGLNCEISLIYRDRSWPA